MKLIATVLQGLAFAACGSALAQTPSAQTSGAPNIADVASGHALAERWCAICHAVEANPQHVPDVPPTFAAVAAMKSTTETSLKVFLQTPHANMPDLRLSHGEIDDVVAYILSLKKS